MSKNLFDVVKTGKDVQKIVQAVAFSIDATAVQEKLEDLGLDVEVSEIDTNSETPGVFTIEGGENETGVILTLQLLKVEYAFDVLNMKPLDNGYES